MSNTCWAAVQMCVIQDRKAPLQKVSMKYTSLELHSQCTRRKLAELFHLHVYLQSFGKLPTHFSG